MDRGAWWDTVQGVTNSQTTEVIEHACIHRHTLDASRSPVFRIMKRKIQEYAHIPGNSSCKNVLKEQSMVSIL